MSWVATQPTGLDARRDTAGPVFLEAIPELPAPDAWAKAVNRPMGEAELATLRRCVARGSPFGAVE